MTAEGRESRADAAETTIVYVDDDPEAADEVLGALREELPAAAIRYVDDATQLLQNGLDDVDCLVSADQLAETAGVNLVRAVRDVGAAVPVLLYGDPDTPAEITAAFDAGATDYLQRVGDAAPTALARKVAAIVDANARFAGDDGVEEIASPPTESLPAKEYRVIAEVASDAIVTIDERSRIHYANPAVEDVFGYDPEELVGEPLTTLMPDELVDPHLEGLGRYVETGERALDWSYLELPGERKDGTEIPLSVSFGEFERDGRTFFSGIMRDVSERKERERELEETRHRYQTLVDHFPNGAVTLVDQNRRYVAFGGTTAGATDLSRSDVEGEPIRDALPDELAEVVVPHYEAALDGEHAQFESELDDGIYQFHFVPVRDDDGEVFAAMGTSQDVTEQRERERALRRERDLNEHIVEATPVGIVTIEADGSIGLVNERAEEILGYSAAEFGELAGGAERLDLVGPDGESLADEDVPTRRVLEDGETVHDEVVGLRRPDGDLVWISVSGTPMRDDGTVSGAVMTFADVTERRERERALRERERQLQRHTQYTDDVLDAVDDVFYVLDEDANFQRWNESLSEVTGYSDAEIGSLQSPDLFREEDRELIADAVAKGFETGSTQVEAPFLTKSGETVPYEFVATRLEDPDGEPVIAGIGRDITDRRERERQLEVFVQQQHALSQLRRKALEDVDLDELFAETVERVADVLGHEYAEVLELQEGGDELLLRSGVGWDEGIAGTATVDTRENSQAGYTLQESGPVVVEDLGAEPRFTGTELLTSHDVSGGISVIVGPRDNPWGVLGTHTTDPRSYADHEVEFVQHAADMLATAIERERNDQQIAALSDVTRVLMEVESPEAVCDIVVDAAAGDLELPIASVALYDETAGQLRPAAATTLGEQLFAETELFEVASGLAWDAFVNDERRTDAPDRRVELPAEPVYLRERVALPLGKHGVLLVGIAGEGTMPDPQLDFVETVAATVRAALDRAEREATLRDREAALQRRNEDLERLARLNEVVRGIERVLVGASTRSEIESAVCELLATVEPYELAWLGQPDAASGDLRRVAAAGETAYLDDVDLTASPDDDPEPCLAAADAGEVRVAERVHAEPPLSGWRQAALRHGFSSAVGVPIEYGGYRYGVLTVYGDRTSLFDERERETLVDLGDTIAYAINAVESKRALVGDEVVELELELYDPDAFVFQFLSETGGRFEFENVFLQDGRGLRTLFSATDVTSVEIQDYADRSPFVEELRRITDDDPPLFECTLTEDGFIPRLFDHGARPQQLSATAEGAQLVVELPATVDVRGFVEMLQTLFEDVELLARRERTLETRSRREFQAELDAVLTERQREVLRTAYFGGFFETPRRRTGKEIGESLDISQPTFNHHLRAAQRKLFELLYGSPDADPESA